jgi:penicillin-binding protein 2
METNSSNINRRVLILLIIIFLIFIIFIGKIFSIQIVHSTKKSSKANSELFRTERVYPLRGKIYASDSEQPLAYNVETFNVYVIPALVPDENRSEIFTLAEEILELKTGTLEQQLSKNKRYMHTNIQVASAVSLKKIIALAENKEKLSGLNWKTVPKRKCRDLGSLAHIVGYVGNISEREYQRINAEKGRPEEKKYDQNDKIGKLGIESYYEDLLRGSFGQKTSMRDVTNKVIEETITISPPENGKDLFLTVNTRIQTLCEKALGKRTGSVIVLKPATGEILAMVSYPSFEPELFYQDTNNYTKYSQNPKKPFINRAIMSKYAPASTFKAIMTTAILEENIIDPDEKIRCLGKKYIGDRYFRCHQHYGHGYLDLKNALAESCNVYFFTTGLKLKYHRIKDYAHKFGLGQPTQIDLPGEEYEIFYKQQSEWRKGDTANISIGQGDLNVTPLHMANVMSMIVNKGVIYKPHFLKYTKDSNTGEIIDTIKPEILHQVEIRQSTWDTLTEYMRYVVTDGTASSVITTKAVKVAGKTGTGEVGRKSRWNAWFTAFGPYDAPPEDQVVVVTMVDAQNEWEWWAIRAANIIFHGIFADRTFEQSVKDLRVGWWFK